MPYLHCNNCHHEYEAADENELCDWCGSTGYILEETTPLEKMIKKIYENLKTKGKIFGIF